MEVREVTTRELLELDMVTVYRNLKAGLNVVFTDKTVYIPSKELKINRIVWEVFRELDMYEFPSNHDIQNFYIDGFYHSKSVLEMLEGVFREVVDRYVIPTRDRSILNTKFYKLLTQVYSDLNELIVLDNIEYISSLNILDFLDIQFKPELLKAIEDVDKHSDPETVKKAYDVLDNLMYHDESLKDNPLRIGYITKNFRIPQLQQMLACIGFASEINNTIFNRPIATTYVLGLNDAYEAGTTARDAIKACVALSEEIKTAEYTARTLQMVTSNMVNVVDGDCGSTDYKTWYIEDNDEKLKEVSGKFYLDEKTNTLKEIRPTDKHLKGTMVKLRHVQGCKHKSARHVCFTCFGTNAVNYPYLSRIGHAAAAETTQGHNQKVISKKHHVGTSGFLEYELTPELSQIFKVVRERKDKIENTKLAINESWIKKGCRYEMHIKSESMKGVKDLINVTNVNSVNPASISAIDEFYFTITNTKDNSTMYEDVAIGMNVSSKNSKKKRVNPGFLRTEFLKYMMGDGDHKRYYLDNTSTYVIDITDWNFKEPIFEFKLVQMNSANFIKDLKELITSLSDKDTCVDLALTNFSNILNDAYGIPLALSEILVASFTVRDPDNDDYSCGRGVSERVKKLNDIMAHWSVGAAYGYERQMLFMFDYGVFGNNANDHLLDGLLCPQEVYDAEMEKVRKYGRNYEDAYLATH